MKYLAPLLFSGLTWANQIPLNSWNSPASNGFAQESFDARLFTPLESFSALREQEFTTFGHPIFPTYSVRLKKTKFCDENVNAYTGYIDIQARHLFFYFFESRSNPDQDDVIFWTNGGPGCSSSLGLFMELGPCRISDLNGTVHHPESWNTNANVFFIDQPIGVGFSYADYGETVSTTEEAAQDIAAFVAIWFENFSSFEGRRFHMAGESYGGRYIPVFASAVYDQNALLVENGMTPINLVSAMIGNGVTDDFSLILSYYDMHCTGASVDPVVGISSCVAQKAMIPRCEKWMKSSCVDQFDKINCNAAVSYCESVFSDAFYTTGRNPYDMSRPCDGPISDTLCYPVTKFISHWLDKPEVRSLLGVDPSITTNFSSCSGFVGSAFDQAGDILHPTADHVGALLERNVKVLVYVGTYDWICNWVANERWTLALQWTGTDEFTSQPLKVWTHDGKRAGRTRSAKGLTYATVEGAGHMVPYDKPAEALTLVQRWIADLPL